MNWKVSVMTLSLMLGVGFLTSCGNDDENDEPEQELPSTGGVSGWTSATHVPPEGGRQYFVDFHSPNETATINISKVDKDHFTLSYSSDAWGEATFASLEVKEVEGRYVFPAGAKTTIVMQRGAMGQQGGGGEYELTLLEGSVDKELKHVSLVMSAFMNENHGSYQLTFNEGDAPAPVVQ